MPNIDVDAPDAPLTKIRTWEYVDGVWVETVEDGPAKSPWPALISLPNGQIIDADATGVFLTDEQYQQIDPDAVTSGLIGDSA